VDGCCYKHINLRDKVEVKTETSTQPQLGGSSAYRCSIKPHLTYSRFALIIAKTCIDAGGTLHKPTLEKQVWIAGIVSRRRGKTNRNSTTAAKGLKQETEPKEYSLVG